jgi:hypothetical protein
LGVVLDEVGESGLELLAVDINTKGIVQSNLILGGIFAVEDGLEDRDQLTTFTTEPGISVVDDVFNGGVVDGLSPFEEEVNKDLSRCVIVAERELERSGQVVPEEDTVLEGFNGFIESILVGSVIAHGLEDGSISITSLVVASSIKQVVDASPSEVPVSDMSLVIDFLEDIFNGLVEVANVHGNEEVLVILAVEDTLDGLIHGGIQSNDFREIDVNVGVVSSNESTSEVVESLEVLEIGFSGNIVPA